MTITTLNTTGIPAKEMQCNEDHFHITKQALDRGLYFRTFTPLAVISGAGVSGLASSLVLRERGFKVIVIEKRRNFSRFNVVNLNVETQAFLEKFGLLKKFEEFVAARIHEHRYVQVCKDGSTKRFAHSDVSELRLDKSIPFTPKNFGYLFKQDGIYSVPIGVLQTFLAENALDVGVNIFGDTTGKILSRTKEGGVSKVQITPNQIVQPDLFFIAEGAHSTTAKDLGMRTEEVINSCTGEHWIFGNMTYSGKETFVVSLIDTSEKILRLANVIFNAQSKVVNIAVTSEKELPKSTIKKRLLETADQVFAQKAFPLEEMNCELLATVPQPVCIANRISSPFSIGNTFCIGDSAGSSSPLAGLGATLGMTLVPCAVEQLLYDRERTPENIHANFHRFSQGSVLRWIQKSGEIKTLCEEILRKEHGMSQEVCSK